MGYWFPLILAILMILLSNTIFVDKPIQCYDEPNRFCVVLF
jgi:hypothetical protein